MAIMLLFLDVLIYNYTNYNSFFFLVAINLYDQNDYIKILTLGLTLDLILLNQPFINTISLFLIFIINKRFIKIQTKNLNDYVYINLFNFLIYNSILIIINQNLDIYKFMISLIVNFLFYLLSYNLVQKNIKLSR